MAFPMDNVLQVARANFRLGLGLMDVARKGTQRLFEIGNEEAAELAEEGRLTLEQSQSRLAGKKPGWPVGAVGRLQDIASEFNELQASTATETRALFDNWWQALSGAMVPPASDTAGDNLSALFRLWDGGKPAAAPARKSPAAATAS